MDENTTLFSPCTRSCIVRCALLLLPLAGTKKDGKRENKTRLTESTGKLIEEGRGKIGGDFTLKASRPAADGIAELVLFGFRVSSLSSRFVGGNLCGSGDGFSRGRCTSLFFVLFIAARGAVVCAPN